MRDDSAGRLIYRPGMTAEEELAQVLARLRGEHDVLPFLGEQLNSTAATFRRLPDEMVDPLATSPDFRPPESGGAGLTAS
jgi:hypothetical protein